MSKVWRGLYSYHRDLCGWLQLLISVASLFLRGMRWLTCTKLTQYSVILHLLHFERHIQTKHKENQNIPSDHFWIWWAGVQEYIKVMSIIQNKMFSMFLWTYAREIRVADMMKFECSSYKWSFWNFVIQWFPTSFISRNILKLVKEDTFSPADTKLKRSCNNV